MGEGSAPHMRGIRCGTTPKTRRKRISPAHAGNTDRVCRASSRLGDQPRTCGEYMKTLPKMACRDGSAPHMRGILSTASFVVPPYRISPAHAGNTIGRRPVPGEIEDQPRTCGEYSRRRDSGVCYVGSAPHMRGIRRKPQPPHPRGRISPAHAGNTWWWCCCWCTFLDQPRTCGEYRLSIVPCQHRRGISPAHAGNTASAAAEQAPRVGSAPHMRGIHSSLGGS